MHVPLLLRSFSGEQGWRRIQSFCSSTWTKCFTSWQLGLTYLIWRSWRPAHGACGGCWLCRGGCGKSRLCTGQPFSRFWTRLSVGSGDLSSDCTEKSSKGRTSASASADCGALSSPMQQSDSSWRMSAPSLWLLPTYDARCGARAGRPLPGDVRGWLVRCPFDCRSL